MCVAQTAGEQLDLEQQQLTISLDEYLVPPQLPAVLGFLVEPFKTLLGM